ncbi:sensor histidine kinase [Pontiella sp.]|uniref:sensor histidine kinase n=1 Tax=Pontiella sp. TaxID=2837462 RepID=UPI003561DA42
MKPIDILYLLCCVGYLFLTRLCYVQCGAEVMLPSLVLIALAALLYGTTGGLLAILALLPHSYFVCEWLRSAEISWPEYGYRLIFIFIGVCLTYFTSYIHSLHAQAKRLNSAMDHRVAELTSELGALTALLIERDEELRVKLGQDIHDGLGQYLTGLSLYSSSLESELRDKESKEAALAESISRNAQKTLLLARKVSRTLFPVRIAETGLDAALSELASYFSETNDVPLSIQLDDCHSTLPDQSLRHLYRIIYEGILHFIRHENPSRIRINLSGSNERCILHMESDGTGKGKSVGAPAELELMQYRVQQVNGSLSIDPESSGVTSISCTMPWNSANFSNIGDALTDA